MARIAKEVKEGKEIVAESSSTVSKDDRAAIEILKRSMNKKYGDGDQVFITDYDMDLEGIPTGSAILDALIGNSGWAEGRVHEIHGQSGSGKSSIVTLTCANALKKHPDKFILYIDAEQAQNFRYMKLLGLDMEKDDRILFTQVNSAEEAFDIINNSIKTGAFSLIVLDSVPAIQTKREMSGDFTQETMAEKARFLSKSIPQLLKPLKRSNTTLIFVNQVRDKMDMWGSSVTPGGKAIPFYSSTRVKVNSTPSKRIRGPNENYIGQTVEFSVVKNKVGNPFGVAESNLYFGVGFNPVEELVSTAVKAGIITRAGAWFTIPVKNDKGEFIKCQGENGCCVYYKEHLDHLEELRQIVNKHKDSIFDQMSDEDVKEAAESEVLDE